MVSIHFQEVFIDFQVEYLSVPQRRILNEGTEGESPRWCTLSQAATLHNFSLLGLFFPARSRKDQDHQATPQRGGLSLLPVDLYL